MTVRGCLAADLIRKNGQLRNGEPRFSIDPGDKNHASTKETE